MVVIFIHLADAVECVAFFILLQEKHLVIVVGEFLLREFEIGQSK